MRVIRSVVVLGLIAVASSCKEGPKFHPGAGQGGMAPGGIGGAGGGAKATGAGGAQVDGAAGKTMTTGAGGAALGSAGLGGGVASMGGGSASPGPISQGGAGGRLGGAGGGPTGGAGLGGAGTAGTGSGGPGSGGTGTGGAIATGGVPAGMGGADGECSTGSDCSYPGAVCQDRTCICQQKSSTNLLQEPGFDAPLSLSRWDTVENPYQTWARDDANGCPKSGSLKVLSAPPGSGASGGFVQCVQARGAANYSFGFSYKQDRGSAFVCFVLFYGGQGCGVNFDPILETVGPFSDSEVRTRWTALSMSHMSPADTQSITFRCATSGAETVSFDQIFLNSGGTGF